MKIQRGQKCHPHGRKNIILETSSWILQYQTDNIAMIQVSQRTQEATVLRNHVASMVKICQDSSHEFIQSRLSLEQQLAG